MEAKDLKEGDKLSTADGESATVERTEKVVHDEPVKVYNFAVIDTHTYYVGEVGVLVHNMCQKAVNDVADDATEIQKNIFPENMEDFLPEIERTTSIKSNGTISQKNYTSDSIRIRAEKHSLLDGEIYNPRHHGTHYHVEQRIDINKSWNNPKNIRKIYPQAYAKGKGSGFLPGEEFPRTD